MLKPGATNIENKQQKKPKRTWKRGPRPGPTTAKLGTKCPNPNLCEDKSHQKVNSKWQEFDVDQLSDKDVRLLFSKVVKYAVLNIFQHHMYMFAGKTYWQLRGRPIGIWLMSIVAHIVMDHWSHLFLDKITTAGVEVHMLMKYVDDINVVNEMLPVGTRWVSGELVQTAQWELEDWASGRSREMSMECLRSAADSTGLAPVHI